MYENNGFQIFSIGGIPVSLSLSFFIIAAIIIGLNGVAAGVPLLLAIFFSVLIHEFGHALVAKYFNLQPSVLLHGFGGLCFHLPASSDKRDALVVVMGPILQMIAGGIMLAVFFFLPEMNTSAVTKFFMSFVYFFIWVSFVWGALNLFLPIWPLDGGRLFHLILRRFMAESSAQKWALRVSMVTLLPLAALAIYYRLFFVIIIIMMLLVENYQALQSESPMVGRGSERPKKMTAFSKELLSDAEMAFKQEDWREAARLCHQVRHNSQVLPEKKLMRIWHILGIANTQLGEYEEALNYLKRAKQTPEIQEATALCESHVN